MKTSIETNARPFLKWAGGKRQLLNEFEDFFPEDLKKGKIENYIEPFIGSGAVFFHIASKYEVKNYFISDINADLILAYKVIKQDVESLIELLKEYQADYHSMDKNSQKMRYYEIRNKYNEKLRGFDYNTSSSDWVERSAQIIFLNRTCFNGLFRVNSKGEFNVPIGNYNNPTICDEENLFSVKELLQNTTIEWGDYTVCKKYVNENTFIYFDPPYLPISETSHFTAYSKESFGRKEQEELAKFYHELHKTGAKLMLSNSDPTNVNPDETFFNDKYRGDNIYLNKVNASRMINSIKEKRGKIRELIIVNYD